MYVSVIQEFMPRNFSTLHILICIIFFIKPKSANIIDCMYNSVYFHIKLTFCV